MSKRRILLVDDEANFTHLVRMNLEATGQYEVRVEDQGKMAAPAAEAFHPDLVLLDVVMPDMDGAAVAQQFKTNPALQRIPIVFLTAIVSRREVQTTGGTIGDHTFLPKPISVQELIQGIERQLAA